MAIVGAGSVSFALGTLRDLVLSGRLREDSDLEIVLMDISEANLDRTHGYAAQMFAAFSHPARILKTVDLDRAVDGADFVIVAIEVDRYFYWSQDFHIPRRYGSRQIYGENGGPGAMFHTLRNMGPMLEIARTMERLCPNAWLINYTNPEAKLVEAVATLTPVKVVGLCHGLDMGLWQLSELLEMDAKEIGVEGGGLNHFGFFTKIWNKKTGEDLSPLLREKEGKANKLSKFDHFYLMRAMYRLYGCYPYPGTNHCGEYVSYGGDFYAGLPLNYAYDPLSEKPWESRDAVPEFVYCASPDTVDRAHFGGGKNGAAWDEVFIFDKDKVGSSGEYGVPIIEAVSFDDEIEINAANMPNKGAIRGLPDDMVVETQATVNGRGVSLKPMKTALPTAVIGTINVQGAIHKLLIEAWLEKSKRKLLQAVLLDPGAPSYYQACAMIDDMCERQKDILPPLEWG